MGFKQHKLSYDKTKQIKTLHHRLKYTHKYQISAFMKTSPPFALNTVKTPSHFCFLVGTVFALGNQIWLHSFGLTQGDDQWDLLALHSPSIYLGKPLLSVVWREGRLLPAGGRLIPHTPLCDGLWHTYTHPPMPGLNYIQMGQSVIVVSRVPPHSVVRKRHQCCSCGAAFHADFDKKSPIQHFYLRIFTIYKKQLQKTGEKRGIWFSSGVIYATNMWLFLVMESILGESVR